MTDYMEPVAAIVDPHFYYKEKFAWRWRGPDYAEVGTTRAWLFPGNRVCRELTITVMDCDGDFAIWRVMEGENEIAGSDNARDTTEAFRLVYETVERLKAEIARR